MTNPYLDPGETQTVEMRYGVPFQAGAKPVWSGTVCLAPSPDAPVPVQAAAPAARPRPMTRTGSTSVTPAPTATFGRRSPVTGDYEVSYPVVGHASGRQSWKQDADIELAASAIEPLYERIHAILTAARTNVARTVNTEMVRAYWLIGREIVEEEQAGQTRAAYGEDVIAQISSRLQSAFGKGFTRPISNTCACFTWLIRSFWRRNAIRHAVRDESATTGRLNPNSRGHIITFSPE